MNDQTDQPKTGAALPRYRCHKEVFALKITGVRQAPADQERIHAQGDWYLDVEDPFAPVCVGHEFIEKHNPQPGGYYVVYQDGYASFSPAYAFESGYTLDDPADYKRRVRNEHAALHDNIVKLTTFIQSARFDPVENEEKIRMVRQLDAMTAYEVALIERIHAFE